MRYKLTTGRIMHSDSQGGMRLLEWTGSLVPQGVLVKGASEALSAAALYSSDWVNHDIHGL